MAKWESSLFKVPAKKAPAAPADEWSDTVAEAFESVQSKLIYRIEGEFDLTDCIDAQENMESALDSLRCHGSAEIKFRVVDEKRWDEK